MAGDHRWGLPASLLEASWQARGCCSWEGVLLPFPHRLFCPLFPPPQEYIRHKLEEEQRQLEILQQQLLQEQALLLVRQVGAAGGGLPAGRGLPRPPHPASLPSAPLQEYKRKQLEEQRQSERLQRQLQQEHAYLKSLQQQQQQQQQQPKPLYHHNRSSAAAPEKPPWAREVPQEPSP